ncbi:MAG: PEGA domain-containing protein [Polyangiales bacterium]
MFCSLRTVRIVLLALCVSLGVIQSAPATAQSTTGWVLLPVTSEGDAAALATEIRQALVDAGAPVIDDDGATLAFEQSVSAPVQSLSQSDIDAWAERSRNALQALARADYDTAREELLEAQRVAQRAADELNREAERARQVLDTCLFMARAFLETGERHQADRQVRVCRVLVPQVEPRRHRHTPEIHELLERVDAESSGATLELTSSPSGCTARVNGIAQGETPFTMQNVARGEYRVQVECTEERGRLHRVDVGEGVTRVHVDSNFDSRVRSAPVVSAEPGFTIPNAADIAQMMQRSVVVIMRDDEAYRLWRVDPDGNSTEVRSSAGNVAEAAQALVDRNSLDLRFESPRAITVDDIAEPASERAAASLPNPATPLPGWRLGAGLGAVAAGGGLLALGIVFHLDRANIGDAYGDYRMTDSPLGFQENQALWLDSALGPAAISAFAGGALAAAGTALLVREHQRVPWWAWAIGGAGVVVAGSALIPVLTRPECIDVLDPIDGRQVGCIEGDLAGSRATLIAAASLPLIAVPLSALLQSGGDAELSPSVEASAGRLMLSLSGRF